MKRIVILLAVLVLLTVSCLAASDYFVYDSAGWLTGEERSQLIEYAAEKSEATGIDFLICIADDVGEQTSSEYCYDYYYNSDCYKDSLVLLINTEQSTVSAYAYGYATDFFPDEEIDDLTDKLVEDFSEYGYLELFTRYLDNAEAASLPPEQEAREMPDWYPEDVSAFEDFHAVNPPHVVDDADLFTDSQEAEMSAKIADVTAEAGRDLVVFTDVSSYGLSRNVYAADFYTFNGYGFGPDYTGSVLFICMEQGNRGWYTAVTGDAQDILTYDNLNRVDDRLEPYMKDGEYFDGVMKYLDDILYTYRHGGAPKEFPFARLGISFIVGIVIAAVVLGMMKAGMKKVNVATEAREYLVSGSFKLRKSHDIFLYQTVTRTKRESKSGGSGGSFSSSSGRSFSGSGRSF